MDNMCRAGIKSSFSIDWLCYFVCRDPKSTFLNCFRLHKHLTSRSHWTNWTIEHWLGFNLTMFSFLFVFSFISLLLFRLKEDCWTFKSLYDAVLCWDFYFMLVNRFSAAPDPKDTTVNNNYDICSIYHRFQWVSGEILSLMLQSRIDSSLVRHTTSMFVESFHPIALCFYCTQNTDLLGKHQTVMTLSHFF